MIETLIGLGFLGLFIACFISATVLPFSSDIILAAIIVAGWDYRVCLVVASVGGWWGGMVNYYLGRQGKIEWIEKYSNVRREKIQKIEKWLNGKGAYMAFFSWVPVLGNLLVLGLGFLRSNAWMVHLCVLAGMVVRYMVIIFLTLQGIEFLSF